jgi:hypothetical protein
VRRRRADAFENALVLDGCVAWAESDMVNETYGAGILDNSLLCTAAPGTVEWVSDPCCNPVYGLAVVPQ